MRRCAAQVLLRRAADVLGRARPALLLAGKNSRLARLSGYPTESTRCRHVGCQWTSVGGCAAVHGTHGPRLRHPDRRVVRRRASLATATCSACNGDSVAADRRLIATATCSTCNGDMQHLQRCNMQHLQRCNGSRADCNGLEIRRVHQRTCVSAAGTGRRRAAA